MNNYIIKVYKIIWVVIIILGGHNYFRFVHLECINVQSNLGFTKSIFGNIYSMFIFYLPFYLLYFLLSHKKYLQIE
jgi:hypothetical protein